MKKRARLVSGLAAVAAFFFEPLAEASLSRVSAAERAIEAPVLTRTSAPEPESPFTLFAADELTRLLDGRTGTKPIPEIGTGVRMTSSRGAAIAYDTGGRRTYDGRPAGPFDYDDRLVRMERGAGAVGRPREGVCCECDTSGRLLSPAPGRVRLEMGPVRLGSAPFPVGAREYDLRGGLGLLDPGDWIQPARTFTFLRLRRYDARTALWLSEDPLGPVDSPNLYGYVGLRPHEKTDPLGLLTWGETWAFTKSAGVAVGTAALVVGGAVAVGASAPFILVAGGLATAGFAINSAANRLSAGHVETTGQALAVGLGDVTGVTAGVEAATGTEVGTGRTISGTERASRAGIAFGAAAGAVLAPTAARTGAAVRGAVAAARAPVAFENPYTPEALSENPLLGPAPAPSTGGFAALEGTLPPGMQRHHLNQDAAFRDVIPRDEGTAMALYGNAIRQPGSQHAEFHFSLEGFWDQFRLGGAHAGTRPTISEYNRALARALADTGLPEDDVAFGVGEAARNQRAFGLEPGDLVPRIPGRFLKRQ